MTHNFASLHWILFFKRFNWLICFYLIKVFLSSIVYLTFYNIYSINYQRINSTTLIQFKNKHKYVKSVSFMVELREDKCTNTEKCAEYISIETKFEPLLTIGFCMLAHTLLYTTATAMYLYNPYTGWYMFNKWLLVLKFAICLIIPYSFTTKYFDCTETSMDSLVWFVGLLGIVSFFELIYITSNFLAPLVS